MTGTSTSRVSWLWRPVAAGIGWGDVALAGLLSSYAVLIVSGALPATMTGNPRASPLAGAAVLTMTAPVAWERRAPLAATAVLAAGTLGNVLLIGPMVRCGPVLPAIGVLAFFAATRLDRPRLVVAVACCLAAMTLEAYNDPRLGPGFLVAGLPGVIGAAAAGWLVHSRGVTAAALRARNAELRTQRERTAELAVAADRVRIAADLHDFVQDRVSAIAGVASAGRDLVAADPAAARGTLARVESEGRATLARMREVVGNLRAERLTGPQPVLTDLAMLLDRATTADARLTVTGSPRALPAGLELSAYRIVEHLLEALDDAPHARADVRLRFGAEALELSVTGPPGPHPAAALATARERVALLGGTLRIETSPQRCTASALLPLSAGYGHT